MSTHLKPYFPMLWERSELLLEIRKCKDLSTLFDKWSIDHQEQFLNFCTGVSGIKFLYDGFIKELMNPEYTPERLNEFLSLLITDIVVELDNGSLANVEVQKIGYSFPGQRSACYSADLLLRQYKRIRGDRGKHFSYKDIKNVYTIILFEQSTANFHSFPDTYLHYFEQKSDTGLELELLQKFLLIPLDIFHKKQQNKTISNKLDAWLLFFSSDDPNDIIQLITEYPEFQAMYEQAYQMCRNVEKIMSFFSEELRILDRNTVQLMIDEMQDTINSQKNIIDSQKDTIDSQKFEISELKRLIEALKEE